MTNERDAARGVLSQFGISPAWIPRERLDRTEFILLLDRDEFVQADIARITSAVSAVLPHSKVWVIERTPQWDVETL